VSLLLKNTIHNSSYDDISKYITSQTLFSVKDNIDQYHAKKKK